MRVPSFLFALLLVMSCSKKTENPIPAEQIITPIKIISYAPTMAFVGDTVTLVVENIDLTKTYTTSINDVVAETISTTANEIKVRVPVGASSGDIKVAYDNENILVGPMEVLFIEPLAVTSYAPQRGYFGDLITLQADNIDTTNTYTIKIAGVTAGSISSSVSSLQARIPVGATTGDITVEYNNTSLTVGTLEVFPTTDDLYVYYADGYGCDPPDLLTLYKADLASGEILENLGPVRDDYCEWYTLPFMFNPRNNFFIQIFGIGGGQNGGATLAHIPNLETNDTCGFVVFDSYGGPPFEEFKRMGFLGDDSIYYVKYNVEPASGVETMRLVARDIETQNETFIFNFPVVYDWNSSWWIQESYFIPSKNNFAAFIKDENNEQVFLKIELDSQVMTTVPDPNNGDIQDLVITSQEDIYAIRKIDDTIFEIVQLDPDTGQVIFVFDTINAGFFRNLNYSESSNRFFAAFGPGDNANRMESIYMFSPDMGVSSYLKLNDGQLFQGFMLNN